MHSTEDLRTHCQRALESYIADRGEVSLHGGYVVGRRALDKGLSLLDLVTVLHAAYTRALSAARDSNETTRITMHVGEFVAECLSPYEMERRAARDAVDALRRQNELLEEEARRIAHEVHDSSAQLLASVYAELDRATRESPPDARPGLERVRELLNGVEADLRRLAHELRPAMLDDLGLFPALRSLADGVTRRSGLEVLVEGKYEPRLPPSVEIVLYRVVQEALTNVTRHARAARARVTVVQRDATVRCTIADDGVGFTVPDCAAARSQGLGLIGIRERLAVLGGALQCENGADGTGARVIVTVPLEVQHATHSDC